MFSTFGEQQLERVDNNTPSAKLAMWKQDQKTQDAYLELFSNHDLLTKIGYVVFKQYKGKELPTMHCAFVLSICDILLNPKSSGIKCNDKSVTRRINAFLVNNVLQFFEIQSYFLNISIIFICIIN